MGQGSSIFLFKTYVDWTMASWDIRLDEFKVEEVGGQTDFLPIFDF